MQCKCIDNSSDNGNFTLGRIYRVEENVGIWQPTGIIPVNYLKEQFLNLRCVNLKCCKRLFLLCG